MSWDGECETESAGEGMRLMDVFVMHKPHLRFIGRNKQLRHLDTCNTANQNSF